MARSELSDSFYEEIKPRLYRRVGRELRLAGRVLDLGCGSCDLAGYLAKTYHQQVTGIDISADSFPKQRGHSQRGRVRCIKKDAAHLDFVEDGSFDAVVMMWALHEMTRPNDILQEVHRVLRPGGKLLVIEFPRNSLAQRLWNENYYTSKKLADSLDKVGFQQISARQIERKQVLWVNALRGIN